MTGHLFLTLNDGRSMPQLGFGTYQVPNAAAPAIVGRAVADGYRAFDTAAMYDNETGVGAGVRAAPGPRDDLFVATKLWNDRHGFDEARRAFDESLSRLKLDAVDLYLIHWPAPKANRFVETWRALVELRREGRARSIGVSNFTIPHLQRIIDDTGVVPALNQIELHPRFQQRELRAFHDRHGIVTQSWSPLGRGRVFDHPVIRTLAERYGRTPAQVVLRWHIENNLAVIPKSVTPARIAENIAIFDFRLDAADMAAVAGMDDAGGRTGPDPDAFG